MVKLSLIQKSLRPDRVMAIDASTNNIAFAVFDKDELELCGKINFNGVNTYQKVVDAAAKCRAFFDAIDSVDAIVIEHTVFINSPKTAADLALVQGAVLGAAGVKKIRSVAPITWQNFIGNKKLSKEEKHELRQSIPGKSDSWYKSQEREIRKARTIHFADIQYDRILTDNDIADAIGIGHYAINNWEGLTK
jgi:Holliday junction resolvasome RuvABC endonuclease subunit